MQDDEGTLYVEIERLRKALEKHHWPDLVPGDGLCEVCGLDAQECYPRYAGR